MHLDLGHIVVNFAPIRAISVDVNLQIACDSTVLVQYASKQLGVHLLNFSLNLEGVHFVPSATTELDLHDIFAILVA